MCRNRGKVNASLKKISIFNRWKQKRCSKRQSTYCAFVRRPAFRELPCEDHRGLGCPLDSKILWNICWADKRKKRKKKKSKTQCISELNTHDRPRKDKQRQKKLFPCNVLLGWRVSAQVSCGWLWEGQRDWLGHTQHRRLMNDRAHEAQECVHWRGLVGSANPLHTLFDPMTTWGFKTKPCGLSAYSS